MHKPKYDVKNFYHARGLCQAVASNHLFENVTLAVIAFNAIWLAIDTDANKAESLVDSHAVFIVAENMFCTFFSVELGFRFGAFAHKRNCIRDAWFCFDFALVTMMIVETWIMPMVLITTGGGSSGGLGNASILRLMRLMRLSRMARMARLLRAMPELLILVKGMVAATRAVSVTLFLLMIIIYVFGILFRQLAAGGLVGEVFFPGVLSSMHSLVKFGIQHDEIMDLMQAIEDDAAYILIPPFYMFVLLSWLTVLNMLIGVLCEVISAVAGYEHEANQMSYIREKLHEICTMQCDPPDASGRLRVSKDKFMNILADDRSAGLLATIKVDPLGLLDLVDTLFTTPDGDERIFFFDDLVDLFLDQRSSNTATVQDMTDLRKFVKGRLDKLELVAQSKVLALGRMVERGFGLPRGTFESEVIKCKEAKLALLNKNRQSVASCVVENHLRKSMMVGL